jgi:hypothetical protein
VWLSRRVTELRCFSNARVSLLSDAPAPDAGFVLYGVDQDSSALPLAATAAGVGLAGGAGLFLLTTRTTAAGAARVPGRHAAGRHR